MINPLTNPVPFEVYSHFKNNDKYMVIGVFDGNCDIDAQVAYIALYPPYKKHIKPLKDWLESTDKGCFRYRRVSNLGLKCRIKDSKETINEDS